jgi:tellurite resistance protein
MTDVVSRRERYLRAFPVMLFSIVMGMAGLVIVYEKATFLFGVPPLAWQVLMAITLTIFAVVLVSYVLKATAFPDAVREEAHHPVKINFLATLPISFLLVSIALVNEVNPVLAFLFWWVGMAGQLLTILYVFPRWIRHAFQIEHLNPAWFIPIVGTILVPVVGVDAAPLFVSVFFFSVGVFFWAVFFTIILYRLIFHVPPVERFVPTLFILIAPPAVGLIAYFRITGEVDLPGYGLYSLALFFLLLLLTMARHFRMQRFYLSSWAYSFPLDAFAIASMLLFEVTREPLFAVLSVIGMVLATAVIGFVGWATIRQAMAGTLFDEN